jgi:D-alanyl-D-alanine dipeptidase
VKPRRDVHLALPVIALTIAGACGAARQPNPELANQLVDIGVTYPDVQLDIRYATPDNFLGRAMYGAPRCYLVTDAAQRLAAADAALHTEGLRLIVWDCYRPRSVQYAMWEILPDPTYVADPARGSRHNRGAAVDVGVVGLDGELVPLPTDHDDFTPAAHRDAEDLPAAAIANRERLERVMVEAGWIPLASEWWHFDAPNWELYPLRDDPL